MNAYQRLIRSDPAINQLVAELLDVYTCEVSPGKIEAAVCGFTGKSEAEIEALWLALREAAS